MSTEGFRFPLDMEREILETAAAIHPKTIPTLLRACHRIHSWLEPLLYSVIITTEPDDPVFDAIQRKSPAFLQNAVRHVFLGANAVKAAAEHLLPHCSGITSLCFDAFVDRSILGLLANNTHIRKFNISVALDPSILKQPMFLSISHLDIYRDSPVPTKWDDDWCLLASPSLPALTHLCLSDTISVFLLDEVLAGCPRLRVVITAFWRERDWHRALAFANGLTTEDPRAVVMVSGDYTEDWERGARGGEDFWIRAEMFVARKRAGEIEENHYFMG
ncbi:hypothetical protein B0H16DRAFT_532709 [Mycena metata]|uniref:Uncharacterized protein n=1 Tax=Mycena metata TaxID=1033252 RepID=A0AAD7H7J5_9AGAR|nr:hypothetical protein B0H16DRAFT_532709 [Mycena metata]